MAQESARPVRRMPSHDRNQGEAFPRSEAVARVTRKGSEP